MVKKNKIDIKHNLPVRVVNQASTPDSASKNCSFSSQFYDFGAVSVLISSVFLLACLVSIFPFCASSVFFPQGLTSLSSFELQSLSYASVNNSFQAHSNLSRYSTNSKFDRGTSWVLYRTPKRHPAITPVLSLSPL